MRNSRSYFAISWLWLSCFTWNDQVFFMARLGRAGRTRRRNAKIARAARALQQRQLLAETKLNGAQFAFSVIVNGIGYTSAAKVFSTKQYRATIPNLFLHPRTRCNRPDYCPGERICRWSQTSDGTWHDNFPGRVLGSQEKWAVLHCGCSWLEKEKDYCHSCFTTFNKSAPKHVFWECSKYGSLLLSAVGHWALRRCKNHWILSRQRQRGSENFYTNVS